MAAGEKLQGTGPSTGLVEGARSTLKAAGSYFSVNAGTSRKLRIRLLGFGTAWVAFFLVRFLLPLSHGFSGSARATLAVVVWACLLWISEAVPTGITGIAVPFMLVTSGALATPVQALSGFTQQEVFLALSAFIFAAVMHLSGLDRRLAVGMLRKLRVKTVTGATVSLFLTNCIMAFIVPGAVSRSAALLPVVTGVRGFLDTTADTARAVKALVIQGLVYAPMISGLFLLTGGLPNLIVASTIAKDTGVNIGYGQWVELNWVYLLMFLPTLAWTSWHFKTNRTKFGTFFKNEPNSGVPTSSVSDTFSATGKRERLTGPQIAVLCVFIAVALGWAIARSISPGLIGLFGVFILMTPGLVPYSIKQIFENTMWNAFLLLGGALSMTVAMSNSGLGLYLADKAAPLVQDRGWLVVLVAFMVFTQVIRLGMLSNVAAVALLAPILLPLGFRLGVNPIAFTLIVANLDTFAYVLPTQISAAVIAYGTDTFSIKDYARSGIVSLGIAMVFSVAVMVPWLAFMGYPIWSIDGIHLLK